MKEIQDIHDSFLYGIIVEAGCGVTSTEKLMSVAGANKTVYYSLAPYSKEYSNERYGYDYERSVSIEFIKACLDKESTEFDVEKINFVLASSWQLNDGDNEKYTHGWIGLRLKGLGSYYYHISFDRKTVAGFDRKQLLDLIGEQTIRLLHRVISMENHVKLSEGCILDQAFIDYDGRLKTNYFCLINTLENAVNDYPLVFSSIGSRSIRFEELMRTSDVFVINKGSFNPLHHKHVEMLNMFEQQYSKPTKKVLMISTYRPDKPHIDVDELIDRIENITGNGYDLIIMKKPLFYDAFDILKNMSSETKTFYFVIGTDTMNRIISTDESTYGDLRSRKESIDKIVSLFKDRFHWALFDRKDITLSQEYMLYSDMVERMIGYEDDGTSSTKIRDGKIKNRLDE